MLKKMLLASAAGFAVIAGSLYFGAVARAADDGPLFVYRYTKGVLAAPASGENPPVDPGEENPGEGDPDGGDEGEPEEPATAAVPSDIELAAPVLSLIDKNFNGYVDPDDILRMRFVAVNRGAVVADGVTVAVSFPFGEQEHSVSCDFGTLSTNEGDTCNADFYLTPSIIAALGEPDALIDYSGYGALIGLADADFPADAYAMASNEISFMIPAPVTAEHIAVSAPALALLDANGDGYGNAGEVVRMTFKATNIGSMVAENVAFETRFPDDLADPLTCDFASIASAASATCQVNFVLTAALLESLGDYEETVSLDGSASLVAVNGIGYAEGDYSQAFGPVSFMLPSPVTVAYLRLTYSGGWAFECQTGWSSQFLADNLEMTMVFYDRGAKVFVTPGTDFQHTNPTALNLRSSWFLIGAANFGTMTALVGSYNTPSGDPRGKSINFSVDGKACIESKASIVAVGDLTTSYRMEIQAAEIIQRVE